MLIDLLIGKWVFETPYMNSTIIIEKINVHTLNIVEQCTYGGFVPSINNSARLIQLKPFYYTYQYPLFRLLQLTKNSAKISSVNPTYAFTPKIITVISNERILIGNRIYNRI